MGFVGSGIGGFAAIAAQATYGSTFTTPTRTLSVKSANMTYDPHIVQGGPYLRGGSTFVDLGSAHIQTWLDAKGTLQGDVMNTGHALLLATAFGSSGTLTQIGTTTAYELGGSSGISLGLPDQNDGGTSGCSFDMQLGVPEVDGSALQPENYHSCMITKAEWVFDRAGLCTYNYDVDAQYVEKQTALITPSFAGGPIPFAMNGTSSAFKTGTFGAESATDGIRKATITMERKLAVDRIYLGNTYKKLPVSDDYVMITVALETDYTTSAKALFDLFLSNGVTSIICSAVGGAIGSSGSNDTFELNVTNAFLNSGGESPLQGPEIVKNTLTFHGTVDASADSPLTAKLITADSTF